MCNLFDDIAESMRYALQILKWKFKNHAILLVVADHDKPKTHVNFISNIDSRDIPKLLDSVNIHIEVANIVKEK